MAVASPLVEVSGSPRQRGKEHGRLAAQRIRLGIRHYGEQLRRSAFDERALRTAVAEVLPQIEAFDSAYIDEMRGIADGAEVAFDEIVLLNARTELLQIADRQARGPRRHRDPEPDGCTGALALPDATRDGHLIHATNWDWKTECAETTIVLKVRRDDGPDLLTFTEAGALGRTGINSAGISISANYLECERDYRTAGVPLALIRRKVLEQAHLAMALRAVYATPKSASNNVIVGHAGGFAIDFECAPDETFLVQAQHGLIVHANHWLSAVALCKLTDTGIESTPDSLYRDVRVRGLLRRHAGGLTVEHLKDALFDDFESPFSVCRPPRISTARNLSATVAMVIMQPALGLMEVAMLPALDRTFTTYRLELESGPVRSAASAASAPSAASTAAPPAAAVPPRLA